MSRLATITVRCRTHPPLHDRLKPAKSYSKRLFLSGDVGATFACNKSCVASTNVGSRRGYLLTSDTAEVMQRALTIAKIVAICLMTLMPAAIAQQTAVKHPLQPSDTASPRATLRSFIEACNEFYDLAETAQTVEEFNAQVLPAAERIRDCLDLSALPAELRDKVGIESAVYLKEVLDRIDLPDDDAIPGTDDVEAVMRWRVPGTRVTIARVSSGIQEGRYLLSPDTVRHASKFFSAAKQLPYRSEGRRVSAGFSDRYLALTRRRPVLTADTSSPRGTFTLFMNKLDEFFEVVRSQQYVDRSDPKVLAIVTQIHRCFDLSEVSDYARSQYANEAAACLKEVLDRVIVPPAEDIPGPEDLQAVEGGEPLAQWQVPNTKITIGRVTEGPRRGEYLFTPATVRSAVTIYDEVKEHPYRSDGRPVTAGLHEWFLSAPGNPTLAALLDQLPSWFRQRLLGLAVWQWLGLVLVTAACLLLMVATYWIGGIRSDRMKEKSLLRSWLTVSYPIIAMLVPLAFKHISSNYLTIRGTALYVIEFVANLGFLLALIVVIVTVSCRLADSAVALPRPRDRTLDPTLVKILFRSLGIGTAAVVFLEGGRYLGFPLTTLLASAGIGGLAIALSAQGMIKGLFGTITILLDRPYRVGERIVVNGHDGVVEEIGLRSTKIREFQTSHLISIPNDQMADAEIENIGKRKHIRRMFDLRIPIDTSREKIEGALNAIRAILQDHDGMDPDFPPRVHFTEFHPDSVNVRVTYWYSPPDPWQYYAFCEKVNFQICHAFEEHGIQFSRPLEIKFAPHELPSETTVSSNFAPAEK